MQLCSQLERKPMSPSPDPTRPSNSSQPPTRSDDAPFSSEVSVESPVQDSATPTEPESSSSEPQALVPKRPLMRPVSRPQPPSPPPPSGADSAKVAPKPTASPRPEVKPSSPIATIPPAIESAELAPDLTGGPRQQPIPPPSEPKQYRAIGLLRGRYCPSEEQFTRGQLATEDAAAIEAVLLGRVMSLVKNHLDLEQEHLWVVYPRTRETQSDLHVQIVGVWEPEKLQKSDEDEPDDAAEPVPEAVKPPEDEQPASLSPGYEDDYFSIRGEIVFYAPETENVVVKIQQSPRKSTDKAKAFKLQLKGVLPTEKAVGYFWDFQVQRQATALVITGGTSIGLVPPKKKGERRSDRRGSGDRRPPRRRPEGAGGGGRSFSKGGSNRPPSVGAPVRREALPKPSKRTESTGES